MTLKASLMFAKRLIFPRTDKRSSARRSFFGALLCIGLSIVPLIVVISVTNGMIQGMTERIIGLSTNNLQAQISFSKIEEINTAEDFITFADSIKQVEGVDAVYPEIDISALATGKKIRSGIEIRAVQEDIFSVNDKFKKLFTIIEGEPVLGNKNAIIGEKMAHTLGLKIGDTFRIITIKKNKDKMSPKLSSFKVSAIVSSGYQELDELWVFTSLEDAYKNFSLISANYNIMISTPDAFSSDLVRIQYDVKSFVKRSAQIYRWDQIHSAEFENFSSTKVMLIFVMMLIVLVACVNISSAIVMLVMERKKEIAILKSIGAKPSGITFAFLLTGMACGCGGVIIGLPIGLLFSVNANQVIHGIEKIVNVFAKFGYMIKGTPLSEIRTIKLMDPAYYLSEIPIDIPFNQIFLIITSTILLSLIVSIIPAVKAGKEKPLDLLRKN